MIYTPEQYAKIIQGKLRSLNTVKIIYPAAQNIQNIYRERLFEKGINGNESKIGVYSTAPIYASKQIFKNSSGFRPKGKKSNSAKYANGKQRKSMYLQQGYRQLRKIQGMNANFVNLHYTGDLFTDTSGLKIDGESVVVKVSRQINREKISGLTEKYGSETFKHTKQERKIFIEDVTKRLKQYL